MNNKTKTKANKRPENLLFAFLSALSEEEYIVKENLKYVNIEERYANMKLFFCKFEIFSHSYSHLNGNQKSDAFETATKHRIIIMWSCCHSTFLY